jgi:hypothetical protein
MTRRFVFVGAAMAAALSLNLAALASANDYVFEPVKAEIKKGNDVIVSVRLKHKATGKPIGGRRHRSNPDRHGAGRHGRNGLGADTNSER